MGGFARHLLTAISFMHDRGIIHRNLHPGVIYLRRPSRGVSLKIADFDYARVANLKSIAGEAGELGTHGYVAPELWMTDDYDHRVDIFSAGAMLFELYSGKKLYNDLPEMLRHREVWRQKRKWIEDASMRDLFEAMLDVDLDKRQAGFDDALAYFSERY
jgi:serine/threonine protein kinase